MPCFFSWITSAAQSSPRTLEFQKGARSVQETTYFGSSFRSSASSRSNVARCVLRFDIVGERRVVADRREVNEARPTKTTAK